jgi:hypothetical protein
MIKSVNGLSGGDRTPDPQLRRLLLYPTELRTVKHEYKRVRSVAATDPLNFGRSTRIRTLDPLVPNQVRYQTAPHSEGLDSNVFLAQLANALRGIKPLTCDDGSSKRRA